MVFRRRVLLAIIMAGALLTLSFFAVHWSFNVPNVSAVSSAPNLGVYWDAACNKSASSISWGNISVGSEENVSVYVKNWGSDPLILSMNMSDLTPSVAYLKIYLCWDYNDQQLVSGSVVKVTLELFVTPNIDGVKDFSFNIHIGTGLAKSPDFLGDGVVDAADFALLCRAWGAKAGQSNYDYRCDLNNDGIIDAQDYLIFMQYWGLPG